MNKLLKLSAVSMLTIVATTAANAAGYTCEDLIEYTSCNENYALVDGDCILSCGPGSISSNQSCVKCPIGTYATAGSTSCMSCPATGYVDENDDPILATTADDGSGSISDCIVPKNVTIKNEIGLYHFRDSCAYSGLTDDTESDSLLSGVDLENEETCIAIGGQFDETYSTCYGIPGNTDMLKNIIVYENGECVVKDDDGLDLGPNDPDAFWASFEQGTESGQVSYNGEYCECNGSWRRDDGETAWFCE